MGGNWSSMIAEADRTGMLVGSWVTSLTWGILSIQLLGYTRGWHRDSCLEAQGNLQCFRNILRGTVFFLFGSETTITILTLVGANHQLIDTPRGSIESVQVPITSSSAGFLNGCTMAGVNLFLLWRFHRLTKKWWISIPLAICALASTACIFWSVELGINSMDTIMAHPEDFEKILIRVWLGLRIAYGLEVLVVTATLTALLAEFISRMKEDLLTGRQLWSGVTVALALVAFVEVMRGTNSNMLIYANCVSRSYFMSMLFNLAMRDADAFKPKTQSISRISTSLGTGSRAFTEGTYEIRSLQKSGDRDLGDEYHSMDQDHKAVKHERDFALPPFEASRV